MCNPCEGMNHIFNDSESVEANVSRLSSLSPGSVSSGDLPAMCQSEAVLPQPLAHFSQ